MKINGYTLLSIVAAIAFIVIVSASLRPDYAPLRSSANGALACIDYDQPKKDAVIMHHETEYYLLKTKAAVLKENVTKTMQEVGTSNTQKMFIASDSNYFGDPLGDKFIYLETSTKDKAQTEFSIYLKDGETVPAYVKQCSTKGGSKQTIAYWRESQFPPAAFNTKTIQGTDTNFIYPGYVYTNTIFSSEAVLQKAYVQEIGELYFKANETSYKLYNNLGTVYLVAGNEAYEYLPTFTDVEFTGSQKENLQLKWNYLVDTPVYSWYTPN